MRGEASEWLGNSSLLMRKSYGQSHQYEAHEKPLYRKPDWIK
jgi:hypothetical protein